MGTFRSHAPLLAALTAIAGGHSPASGQCRLCATPTTVMAQSPDGQGITLDIETRLDFDRLIIAGEGQGAAVIRPDGSNRTEGSLAALSPRAMVGTAIVHGAPDRVVRVELPPRISLFSVSGGQIAVDDIVTDLPSLPRLDSAGNLSFKFGGRVRISGGSDGDYRGDMPITVEYQ
jgi:hypothetical protein